MQLFWLSESLSHPDELGTSGVRIIEAVLYANVCVKDRSELRKQKPYALPVQCILYAGLKEEDIRRLVCMLIKELVSHGMKVPGEGTGNYKLYCM